MTFALWNCIKALKPYASQTCKRFLVSAPVEQGARLAMPAWQSSVAGLDPNQVKFFFDEKLIMVDDKDEPIGPISKGEAHAIETIEKRVYHRALSLLVFDEQDRFLLTQRAASKITFPGYFTNACCSHPLYTSHELEEDGSAMGVRRAVIRRSNFELGTSIDAFEPTELKFVNKLAYRAKSDGGVWGEAEIDYIFILKKNIKLRLNTDEVQSFRYVTRGEMKKLLISEPKITPWVRLLARDFLFKYWDSLENLDAIADTKSIISYRELM